MSTRRGHIVFLLVLPALLSFGCNTQNSSMFETYYYGKAYEKYDIIVGDYDLEGTAMGNWREVEQVGERIRLSPGARFSIRVDDQTQWLAQIDLAILKGTGANFYTRTVEHEFDPSDGIAFRYAIDGCEARLEDGTSFPLEYNADVKEETVKILSESELVEFSVGCERLYQGTTRLPATEYLIIEAMNDTELELRAINYYDMDEL